MIYTDYTFTGQPMIGAQRDREYNAGACEAELLIQAQGIHLATLDESRIERCRLARRMIDRQASMWLASPGLVTL